MIASPNSIQFSTEAYLEWEKQQDVKHEFIDGEAFAMAGASDAHVSITMNLVALLRGHVRGGSCRVYAAGMKVQIEVLNRFYYPDLFVTCDERDRQYEYFKKHPKLIIEVLSPATEAFNRGRKFSDYRYLESLQEYVLIDSETKSVECFRRGSKGQWILQPYSRGETVWFESLAFSCTIDDIYEDVGLEDPSNKAWQGSAETKSL